MNTKHRVKKQKPSNVTPDYSELNIKIVALSSGEKIICQVQEAKRDVEGKPQFIGYVFQNPQIINVEVPTVLTESVDSETRVTFSPWMNLSPDKDFLIMPDKIVTMCEPLQALSELFQEKIGVHPAGGADGNFEGATVKTSLNPPEGWEPEPEPEDEDEVELMQEFGVMEVDVEEVPADD